VTGFSPTVRSIVMERSDRWCERCGLEYGRELHHRRPRGAGGTKQESSNQPSNALLLCAGCHRATESQRAEAFINGWLVRQPRNPLHVPVMYRGALVYLDDLGGLTDVVEAS
jgi:5-methylcytosine-specific restriction protein A